MADAKTKSNAKGSMFRLDEEQINLNKLIKWPGKLNFQEKTQAVIVILLLLVSSAIGTVTFLLYPLLIIIPFLGTPTLRRWNGFWSDSWFSMWVFISERIYGTKYFVTGDDIPDREAALIICNHPSEADFLAWPSFAVRKGILSTMRFVCKDMLRLPPGTGWAIESFNWLFLTRDWQKDKIQTIWNTSGYVNDKYPVSMIIYPEGTDFTPAKSAKCNKYSETNGLPLYKHVLTPRTKGLILVAKQLRPLVTAVYDVTLAYPDGIKPTPLSALSGQFPNEVHIHLKRIPIDEFPQDKDGITQKCYELFTEKDALLEHFRVNKHFPHKSKQETGYLKELPSTVPMWFCFWILFTFAAIYAYFFTNKWMLYAQVVGWALLIATSVSPKMRVLRGIDAPPDFKIKK